MEEWAQKLFDQHQKPITKLNLFKKKLFKPNDSNVENQVVYDYIKKFAETLNAFKVERRCGRMIIDWSNEEGLGAARKIIGSIFNSYGYQNTNGHFLLPQELLYLLEKNRIELFWNNSPISVEQAFAIHLQKDTLLEYRAYKKLVQQGIRVIRTNKKVTGPPPRKRVKIDKSAIISKEKKNKFHDLFVNLQKNGPQLDDRTLDVNYDFKISLPSSGGCFNYTFTRGDLLSTELSFVERSVPTITSFPTDGFPCYKIISIETVSLT